MSDSTSQKWGSKASVSQGCESHADLLESD